MTPKSLLPLLILLTVTACATGPKRSPVVTPQPMSCTGNIPASVTLYSPTEAKLTYADKSYMLNRIETASGVKYGSREISFWNKGIDAMIIRGDGSMTSCTYVPRAGL